MCLVANRLILPAVPYMNTGGLLRTQIVITKSNRLSSVTKTWAHGKSLGLDVLNWFERASQSWSKESATIGWFALQCLHWQPRPHLFQIMECGKRQVTSKARGVSHRITGAKRKVGLPFGGWMDRTWLMGEKRHKTHSLSFHPDAILPNLVYSIFVLSWTPKLRSTYNNVKVVLF